MPEGVDLAQEVQSPLEFEVALSDQSFEVHGVPPGETRCGRRSRPAEINLHLLPRDIVSSFSKGLIKRSDVLRLFKRFEHLVVLIRADHDSHAPSIVLNLNGLGL